VDSWKPSRDKYVRAWQEAGWDVILWHAGQLIDPMPATIVTHCDARELMRGQPTAAAFAYELAHRSHACAADLFRFAVLYELGGSYVDLDVLPRNACEATDHPLFGKPQGAPDLRTMPIFGRPPTAHLAAEALEIRFVSSPARHDLLARIIAKQLDNETAFIGKGGYKRGIDQIVARTGPLMAELVVRGYAREVGMPYSEYLLTGATIDETPENNREHMTERYPEIRAAARKL